MLDSSNLMMCATHGEIKKMMYLLQNGANINYSNSWGENSLIRAVEMKQFETVKLLVENGIDINAKSVVGDTPLSIAKEKGLSEIANYLTEHGAIE